MLLPCGSSDVLFRATVDAAAVRRRKNAARKKKNPLCAELLCFFEEKESFHSVPPATAKLSTGSPASPRARPHKAKPACKVVLDDLNKWSQSIRTKPELGSLLHVTPLPLLLPLPPPTTSTITPFASPHSEGRLQPLDPAAGSPDSFPVSQCSAHTAPPRGHMTRSVSLTHSLPTYSPAAGWWWGEGARGGDGGRRGSVFTSFLFTS